MTDPRSAIRAAAAGRSQEKGTSSGEKVDNWGGRKHEVGKGRR